MRSIRAVGIRAAAVRALALSLVLVGPSGCAGLRPDAAALKPPIIPRDAWEAEPPVGHVADATRRNLAPGDTLRFRELGLTLAAMRPDTLARAAAAAVRAAGTPVDSSALPAPIDRAVLVLARPGARVERTVAEGAAFNWGGYHVAILAVHAAASELGGGLVEFEVATVESLPPEIAASDRAGDAAQRLRIPHEVRTITLHHEGSAEPLRPGDDPVQELRDLQAWGRRDRNWWDVPYHYLIDLAGTIYEGRDARYMGEANATYDPRGHLLIGVLGNYNQQEPTAAQIEAITDLMAWAAAEYDVPLARIYGHGDLADTSCPGRYLRKYLDDGSFREGVRSRLEREGLAPAELQAEIAPVQGTL